MPTEAPALPAAAPGTGSPAAAPASARRGMFAEAIKKAMVEKPPDPSWDEGAQARSEKSGQQLAQVQPGLVKEAPKVEPAKVTEPPKPVVKLEDRILSPEPAPAVEPTPTTAAPVVDLEIPGEKVGVKTSEHFKRQREAHDKEKKELADKLAAAEARVAEFSSKPSVDKTEYEKAVTKATQAEALLKAAAIERDPEFIGELARRNAEIDQGLKTVMKAQKADEILKIVKLSDPEAREERLGKALEGLNPLQQVAVYTALSKHTETENWRTAKVQNAEAEWNSIQERRSNEAKAQRDGFEAKRGELHKLSTTFMDKMDAFKVTAENPESEVNNRKAFVQNFIDGKIDPKLTAATPALAAHALYLQDTMIPKLQKQIADKDALIASLTKSAPAPGKGQGTSQAAPSKGSGNKPMSFTERVTALRAGKLNPNDE